MHILHVPTETLPVSASIMSKNPSQQLCFVLDFGSRRNLFQVTLLSYSLEGEYFMISPWTKY